MSANRWWTTSLSRICVITWRRACRSPRLAKVTSFSAYGRSRLALASVVVIRPCSNSEVARLASISRSCDGDPPRRGPLVGVGMSVLPQAAGGSAGCVRGGAVVRVVRWCSRSVSLPGGQHRTAGYPTVRRGASELLGLLVGGVAVLDVGVLGRPLVGVGLVALVVALDGGGDEPGRAVLEREAHGRQLHLDLVDRLRTEVADVEQVGLGAGHELTDGVHALALEAVVGAEGEVHVLDRHREVRDVGRLGRAGPDLDALGVDVQLAQQAEELDQGGAGAGDRVPRRDRRLGLDVDHEPVEVGPLLDAGRLDGVGDLEDRRVDRVDRDAADLLAGLLVLRRRHVAATPLDDQLDLEAALAVEDDLGDVLLDDRHGGELVQGALDPDAGDSSAGDRGEERATQGVAEGVAETGLEGLDDEPRARLGDRLLGEGRTLCDEHGGSPSGPPATAI